MEIGSGGGEVAAVLRIFGEIDLATAPGFRAEAQALLATSGREHLVLDLSGVEFLDSSGIEMLGSIRIECVDRGVDLVLRAPRRRIVDLLRITGMLGGFVIEDVRG